LPVFYNRNGKYPSVQKKGRPPVGEKEKEDVPKGLKMKTFPTGTSSSFSFFSPTVLLRRRILSAGGWPEHESVEFLGLKIRAWPAKGIDTASGGPAFLSHVCWADAVSFPLPPAATGFFLQHYFSFSLPQANTNKRLWKEK